MASARLIVAMTSTEPITFGTDAPGWTVSVV
jgi:hypothetical protein